MSNLELAGVGVSASNPVPFYETLAPAQGAQTINRTKIAAASAAATGYLAVASNAGRQAILFTNTSGANAFLAGAGFLPTYSASDANAIWDVKVPAGAVLIMDRAAMLPGAISVTFDGTPTGYLRSSEISA